MSGSQPKRGEEQGERVTRSLQFSDFELRAANGDKPPHFSGYATVFNKPYTVRDFFGEYVEVVDPAAFNGTLAAKADVRLLVNHEGLPLARSSSGTLELTEDKRGLKVDADLDPTDPDVARLLPKMARGDLSEMSFAFRVKQQKWTFNDGKKPDERRLMEIDLNDGDVSVVTYPANPATSAQIRTDEAAAIASADSPIVRVAALIARGADLNEHGDLVDQANQAITALRGSPEPTDPLKSQAYRNRLVEIEALA